MLASDKDIVGSVEDNSGTVKGENKPVFLAHNFAVTYKNDNSVARNKAVLEALQGIDEADIVNEYGETTFPMNVNRLGYFLHLVYGNSPSDKFLQVNFNGIYAFTAPDESGQMQNFNAQLIEIIEADEAI